MLTPWQAQVKEELTEPLEFNQIRLIVILLVLELRGPSRSLFLILLSFYIDFPIFQGAILGTL